MKRVGAVVALAAGLVMVGAMAFAATGTFQLSATGVLFNGAGGGDADWKLWADGNGPSYYPHNGGLQYYGYLRDKAADGNNVFVHAKVEGNGYATKIYNNDGNNSKLWVDQYVYAPDNEVAGNGRIEACQDRGSLFSDLCDDRYVVR